LDPLFHHQSRLPIQSILNVMTRIPINTFVCFGSLGRIGTVCVACMRTPLWIIMVTLTDGNRLYVKKLRL
jgi:hypothetical protein